MTDGTYTDRDINPDAGKFFGMGSLKATLIDRQRWFERFKTALQQLHGIDIDVYGAGADACKLLGIESNVLTNWRARGLPPEAFQVLALKGGINPTYILGLTDAMALAPRPVSNSAGTLTDRSRKPHRRA